MDETNIETADPKVHSGRSESRETKMIGISGMTCDECVKTIERALRGKPGVEKVAVDRSAATVTVTYNKLETNLPAIHDLLLRSGYKPTGGVVD